MKVLPASRKVPRFLGVPRRKELNYELSCGNRVFLLCRSPGTGPDVSLSLTALSRLEVGAEETAGGLIDHPTSSSERIFKQCVSLAFSQVLPRGIEPPNVLAF